MGDEIDLDLDCNNTGISMKLQIDNLSKSYGRNQYGLKDFSLSIEPGILGLLGPNGAGKSTLLKMIATVIKPTEGSIRLDGTDLAKQPNEMRKLLGFLPQDFGVYPNLNAYEFLSYMAALKGVGGKGLRQRISSLIEGLNLMEAAKRPIGSYSGGMRQRIGIAQALLNNPKVLLLDEPTVGLDPEERVRFRNLIVDLAQDTIVILSSHIVSDIDTIADQVAIMSKGSLVMANDIPSIIEGIENNVYEALIEKSALAKFKEQHVVVSTQRHVEGMRIRYISNHNSGQGSPQKANLEDAFLFLTKSKIYE